MIDATIHGWDRNVMKKQYIMNLQCTKDTTQSLGKNLYAFDFNLDRFISTAIRYVRIDDCCMLLMSTEM